MKQIVDEAELETAITYILIAGVIASVVVETVGITNYYLTSGNLDIVFQPNFSMTGTDFFNYTMRLIQRFFVGGWTSTQILALGIVLLMLTPYLRVAASVVYFAFARNPKYLFITLFVLLVLTASLLVH